MFNKRGQGTIEYLIIIAIVIVIALVVVGLLLQVMDQGGEIPEQTARIAWQSGTPIAIMDWSQTNNSGDTDANLTLVLKNNSGQTIELNYVKIISEDKNTIVNESLAQGATTKVIIQGLTEVDSGNRFVYPKAQIEIDYNMGGITNRKMSKLADIVGTAN
jgi:uncharacterized protein (UPF0333 family)